MSPLSVREHLLQLTSAFANKTTSISDDTKAKFGVINPLIDDDENGTANVVCGPSSPKCLL